jgi:hypothetical protein
MAETPKIHILPGKDDPNQKTQMRAPARKTTAPVKSVPPRQAAHTDSEAVDDIPFRNVVQLQTPRPPNSASAAIEKPDTKPDKTEPETGPPSAKDWQDFIGRVIISSLTEWYLDARLKNYMEDLSDREFDSIRLEEDELREIASPLATLAHRSKFGKKHGRTIIAAGDSFEAVVTLGMWVSRVNRLSRKYKPRRQAPDTPAQATPQFRHTRQQQSTEGSNVNGQSDPANGVERAAVRIYNPGSGG